MSDATTVRHQSRSSPSRPAAFARGGSRRRTGRRTRRTAPRQAAIFPQEESLPLLRGAQWTSSTTRKAEMLQPFVQDRGKIMPRRMTGTCSKHQRWLGVAIKRARNIALLPFATEL